MPLILNGTTGVSGIDGSAGTPSYQGGDTNTGIFYPAADTIAFAEGGAEIARFDSSGRLLLGTTAVTTSSSQSGEIYSTGAVGFMMTNTTAANYPLSVKNEGTSGTRNLINFYEGAAGGTSRANISFDSSNNFAFASTNATTFSTASTERMRIDSSGNVGIGTSSPGCKLDVYNSAAAAANNEILRLRYVTSTTAGHSGDLNFTNNTGIVLNRISSVIQDGSNVALVFSNYGSGSLGERMRITAGGNLLVGTTSTLGAVSHTFFGSATTLFSCRNTNAAANNYYEFGHDSNNNFRVTNQSATGVYLTNGGTSWIALSDENSKVDLHPITNAAEKVSTLRAVTGRYKTDHENISRAFLIAQDVQKVLPEAVNENADGSLGLSYTETIPLLVKAIQEQQAMIEELKAKVAALEK